jgi:hypothetical protein
LAEQTRFFPKSHRLRSVGVGLERTSRFPQKNRLPQISTQILCGCGAMDPGLSGPVELMTSSSPPPPSVGASPHPRPQPRPGASVPGRQCGEHPRATVGTWETHHPVGRGAPAEAPCPSASGPAPNPERLWSRRLKLPTLASRPSPLALRPRSLDIYPQRVNVHPGQEGRPALWETRRHEDDVPRDQGLLYQAMITSSYGGALLFELSRIDRRYSFI